MMYMRSPTLSSFTFAAGIFLSSTQTQAACGQWSMPAKIEIRQSNGSEVKINSTPSQAGFVGTARYWSEIDDRSFITSGDEYNWVIGVLEGAVEGSTAHFTIHWQGDRAKRVQNSTGVYTGTISPEGRLTGTGYDADHPGTTATWFALEPMKCSIAQALTLDSGPELERRPPPVSLGRVQAKPEYKSLGRVQSTQGADPLDKKQVPMSVLLNPPPICASASSARARGSPAAPGLERQCQIAMEQSAAVARVEPPPVVAPSVPASPPTPLPPVSGNPWPAPRVANGPSQLSSVCEAARDARYNNSPYANVLEDQCRAQGGSGPGPGASAPYPPAPSQPSPICEAARVARYYDSPGALMLEQQCLVQGSAGPGPVANSPYPPTMSPPSPICEAAQRARYDNNLAADRLEALCRAGNDVWGQPGKRRP